MGEGSGPGLVRDGKNFVFRELGLEKEQLRLLGKLAWLRVDSGVEIMEYNPGSRHISVKFKRELSIREFEGLLEKYEIQEEYSRNASVAGISPWGAGGLEVYFRPVV